MADGSIVIDTKVDTAGAEKGVKNLSAGLGSLAKKAVPVAAVAVSLKKVSDEIIKTTELYKKQAKAEIQLETAAKNNPYLDGNSVKQLKAYASELQGIGTVGDEALLPFMAELAAAGRTQNEIQAIMAASLDASASGAISLESAVQSLNRSLNGEVGMLGRVLPGVKDLTAEELKEGKAIQMVASAYSGMSREIAEAVGSSEQLSNAWGDFKEYMGGFANQIIAPAEKGLLRVVNSFNSLMAKMKQASDNESAAKKNQSGKSSLETLKTELASVTAEINKLSANTNRTDFGNTQLRQLYSRASELREYIRLAERETSISAANAKYAENQAQEAKAKADAEKSVADNYAKAQEAYEQTLKKMENEIRMRKEAGMALSEEEETQLRIDTEYSAMIQRIEDSNGAITEKNALTISSLNKIKSLLESMENPEDIASSFDFSINRDDIESSYESLKNYIKTSYDEILSQDGITAEKRIQIKEGLNDALNKLDVEYGKALKTRQEEIRDAFVDLGMSVIDSFALVSQSLSNAVSASSEADLQILENTYNKGLITEEEYNQKKAQLQEEAAEKKYKIDMATWAIQIAQATANAAMAVSSVWGDNTISTTIKPIMAAIAATNGAAALASVIAAKPVKAYETGGIVPGTSYSGDNVFARVNSGEMILNQRQQQNMFNALNSSGMGNGGTTVNMPVTIENRTSAQVSSSMDAKGLKILVEDVVNAGMKQGHYTESMEIAQGRSSGRKIL